MSVFTKANHEYVRTYDLVTNAKKDLAFYLSRRASIPEDQAYQFVQQVLTDGRFNIKNPGFRFLERQDNGDRVESEMPLTDFLNMVVTEGLIIAPSLTVYLPPRVKKSVLAEYIQMNMKLRKADKHEMFLASMRKEKVRASYYKTLQESRKIKNNSLSGMHASPSTPWYNKTAHSTLTSGCRCATSYANAGNEKFLGGLRHYYSPAMVINHILVAARHSDITLIEYVIQQYNLHIPTPDECMDIMRRSTNYYWSDPKQEVEIYALLSAITPYERAAWAYTGDMYHLYQYNKAYIKSLLDELSQMVEGEIEDPKAIIKSLDDNYLSIATLLAAPVINGIALSDAEKERVEAYKTVALTGKNLLEVSQRYHNFFQAFIRQDYLPLSIAAFPASMRESVPTSDTDSTIFTTQYWVHEFGEKPFSHEANKTQYIMTFLVAGMTEHTLKMYSANLGIEPKQLGQIRMKNEYIFPTYSLTPLAKHYFAYLSAQEGNVFDRLKTEIKGVNMRSSNAPPIVNEKAADLMRHLMDLQMQGKDIYLEDIIKPVVEMERYVIDSILKGKSEMLNATQINTANSYKVGEQAPAYQSYLFWNEYFAHKYGPAPTLPYKALKVGVDLPNRTTIQNWLKSIQDQKIKEGLTRWVEENDKADIKLFRLPMSILAETGIPEEIVPVLSIRKSVAEIMKPFYYILETCGLFLLNKNYTRLISEEYPIYNDPVQPTT